MEEVKIFSVDLTGVVGQNIRRVESDINTYLTTRDFISIEQTFLPAIDTSKPRLIVTVVAKRKPEN